MTTAVRRFNAAQGQAQEGLALQRRAFEDSGVDVNLTAQEALPAVARALLSITDTARRSSDEIALFGRSGEELNPVLAEWARGTETIIADLKEQNRLLDPETAEAAENARIAMGKAWDSLVTEAQPAITGTLNLLAEMVGAFGQTLSGGGEVSQGHRLQCRGIWPEGQPSGRRSQR